jgi:glycerol-3-phosphate acyltransferase PlsX
MGGDRAPLCVVKGAAKALQRYPELEFRFYGDGEKIEPLVKKQKKLKKRYEIIHTDQQVMADDKPSIALRKGKQTSMRLAIDAVKDGDCFAIVSAGNTGALMAMSKMVLGTLPGVSRPAITALIPTFHGECVMLDMGANITADSDALFHYALMGDAFARAVIGLKQPTIGLLNVGAEEIKGHEELKEASQKLKDTPLELDFHGFIEGDDIVKGVVDVVVTDGFTGNIALKAIEGTGALISYYLLQALNSSIISQIGALIARASLSAVKAKIDHRKYNGAMFLGLNGISVKSHGSADSLSFANAIAVAAELQLHNTNQRIIDEIDMINGGKEMPSLNRPELVKGG